MAKLSMTELISETETGIGMANPSETIDIGVPTADIAIDISQPNTVEKQEISVEQMGLKPTVNTAGIDVKESIEAEVLGDPFEQYKKEKAEQMQQLNDSIDLHNQIVAAALGEDVPDDITDADIARSKAAHLDLEKEENDVYKEESTDEYVDDLEKELAEDDDADVEPEAPKTMVSPKVVPIVNDTVDEEIDPSKVSFDIDESDIKELGLDEDDDDIEVDESEAQAEEEQLKAEITDKLSTVSKNLNISTFTRAKKAVRASSIIKHMQPRSAEWPLMNAGIKISMSNLSGTDIDELSGSGSENLTKYAAVYNIYKVFYNHLSSANKPESVEAFVKSIPFMDNDNLYMAAYIASFSGANYIPMVCGKCKHNFITDNIPMKDMYEVEGEAKERFDQILRDDSEVDGVYAAVEVPISDVISITFRDPSVYTILFENAFLDDTFARKYQGVIAILSYIDEICFINQEDGQTYPLYYKRFPTNKVKDLKSRIIEYSKIIKALTPDQYNMVVAYINAINNRKRTVIKYQLPEVVCPKCGEVIPAQTITAQNMVFIRHQLAALATTSIK